MKKFITVCSLCLFSAVPLAGAAHADDSGSNPSMFGSGASSTDNDTMGDWGLEFKPYVGVGIGALSISNSGFQQYSLAPPATKYFPRSTQAYIYTTVGVTLHRYFDIEMRLGTTRADANTYDPTFGSDKATADWVWSLFAKPKIYLTDNISIYGLIGGTTARISGRGIGSPSNIQTVGSKTSSGFSYGGGLSYKASDHFTIGAEYVQYLSRVGATPPTPNSVSLASYDVNLQYSF
jgi:opacity protein-like surface antigen